MWNSDQRWRLALEKNILDKKMPHFQFYNPCADTFIAGIHKSEILGRLYSLKLTLPPNYPSQNPCLYITSPYPLMQYDFLKTINEVGLSHQFHTLNNGPDGCVQICCAHWNASRVCMEVIMQGMYWIRAYETHLMTGKTIHEIIEEWRKKHGHANQ